MPTPHQDAYKSYTQWLIQDLKGRGIREPLPYPSHLPQKGEGLKSQAKVLPGKAEKKLSACEQLIERSPFSSGALIGFRLDSACNGELFVWGIECTKLTKGYTYTNVSGEKKYLFPRGNSHVDVSGFHQCENGEFRICQTCGGRGKISYEKTVKDGSWHSEGFNSASIDTRRTTNVQATEVCPVCHGRRFSKKAP